MYFDILFQNLVHQIQKNFVLTFLYNLLHLLDPLEFLDYQLLLVLILNMRLIF